MVGVTSDDVVDEVFSVIELVVVVVAVPMPAIAFAFTLAFAADVGVNCVVDRLSSSSSSSELRLSGWAATVPSLSLVTI